MQPSLEPSPRQDETVEPVPFRHVLFGLFFYPHLALFVLQQRNRWGRALRLVLICCGVCGVALGFAKLPGILHTSQDWARWLAAEVDEAWISDGRLHWRRPKVLPYTTRHRGWRIDFVAQRTPFEPNALPGPEQKGIWIGPERAYAWWRQTQEKAVFLTLLSDRKAGGFLEVARVWPEGWRLQGDAFERETRRVVIQAVPFLLLRESLALFVPVLLYTLVFSLVPVLFRGPLRGGGFRSVFAFHLHASVPPLIVASVYSGLGFPQLDHNTVFVCAFVMYLAVVFMGMRRAAQDTQRTG